MPTRRFSSTVSSGITAWPSGTWAIPALTICSGLRPARSAPASRMRPRRGLIMPLTARSSVVLPAPLAPSTAVIADVPAAMLTPFSAVTPPYPATSSSAASAGVAGTVPLLMGGAEIGRRHGRVVLDLARGARRDHLPEVEDHDRVADGHHQVHVMLDHHERSLGGQVADEPAELGQFALVQAAGGLVEQDQARLGDQRPCQRDPL